MGEIHLPHCHCDNENKIIKCMPSVEDCSSMADIFKQLSDGTRLRILWMLCHLEECVSNIAAAMEMSDPAVSHHLKQLKTSGLIVSRREGKEVCYRAADTEQARLLHIMIERTMEIACPEEDAAEAAAPRSLNPDEKAGQDYGGYPLEQIETIHRVHDLLTEDLSSRITIEELSKRFLMNPSTMK